MRNQLKKWLAQETEKFNKLRGLSVKKWSGVEMAAIEKSSGEPAIWYTPEAPMLQFVYLNVEFSNYKTLSLTTYQNDGIWGLNLIEGVQKSNLVSPEVNCIYREREIQELPCGEISNLSVKHYKTGDISELVFEIGNKTISLKAGEIYQNNDDSVSVVYMDESVLIQINGEMPEIITQQVL